jgi:CheY-like chemotaxis protein
VDVVGDGEAALRQLRQQRYDLVLMDMQMPVLDGLQATLALRAQPALAALPVIAVTANAFEEDRAECLAAGMNDFIPKPVDAEALYATLLKWLPPRARAGAAGAAAGPGPGAAVEAVSRAAPSTVPPPAPEASSAPTATLAPASTSAGEGASVSGSEGPHDALLARLARHPGLDVEGALSRLQGLEHRYGALLRLFVGHHARDGERIAQCLAQRDFDGARFIVHALKGPASSLGAAALAEAALALETRLREGCTDAALLGPAAEALQGQLQSLLELVEEAALEV